MKILDAKQLSEADKITIKKQEISSEELMERAATLVFNEIHSRLQGAQIPLKMFCGIGNNGGDGLVISRLLLEHGYNVTVYVVNYSSNRSDDFLANYEKIKEVTSNWPTLIKSAEDFPALNEKDFIVDAIFGIGLNKPIIGWLKDLLVHINKSKGFILSVDIPSGLFTDRIPAKKDPVIKSNFTISFQAPKLVFFLPETVGYVGDMQIVDIGLDREYLSKVKAEAQLIDKQEAQALYIPRNNFSHKGDYGHCLIVGGSYGKIGSVSLTANACLRSGAGLVTVYAPQCGYAILQSVVPEAMVLTDENEKELHNINFDLEPDVICFGMGVGTSDGTATAFKKLLEITDAPMVIDADGLNILATNPELLEMIPENSVLTPHPKELERLIGEWKDDLDKLSKSKEFASKHKVVLVIKGAHTITVYQDNLYINNTGNPGMATAGSGDVLAGVITSLISQKYDPLVAAVFGVYLHGRTGDIMVEEIGYQGLIAGDIANNMGKAFLDLFKKDSQSE
jgi:ADP-dependent NAD(P)H-hydrate dehydratase / NAD(P)H-hydrate epimerase